MRTVQVAIMCHVFRGDVSNLCAQCVGDEALPCGFRLQQAGGVLFVLPRFPITPRPSISWSHDGRLRHTPLPSGPKFEASCSQPDGVPFVPRYDSRMRSPVCNRNSFADVLNTGTPPRGMSLAVGLCPIGQCNKCS